MNKPSIFLPVRIVSNRMRFLSIILFVALILFSFPIESLHAADGDLDLTFGKGGKVVSDLRNIDQAFDLAFQQDGKIIVIGWILPNSNIDFLVSRYDVNGNLDPTFGNGGRVTTDFAGTHDLANAVAIQNDGKIIVAGSVGDGLGGYHFGLSRYNSDGSLDSSFGNNGKVITRISSDEEANDLVLQSDGKIIVVGVSTPSATKDFTLLRYNPDGSLDTSFGNSGKVITDLFGSADIAVTVAIDSLGRIVAGGFTHNPSNQTEFDFGIVRYKPDGSLDSSFGNNGKINTDFSGGEDEVRDLAIQPDNKIVATGYTVLSSERRNFALARYNTNGTLDSSFGVGGKVSTSISNSFDYSAAIAIQPDGKIIAGGTTVKIDNPVVVRDFALIRYQANGDLDLSFGNGGKVTTDFLNRSDELFAIALQSDGKIVAAGFDFDLRGITADDVIIARYNNNYGSFDSCIQDDSNGSILQINLTSGEYQFINCSGFTLGGTGILKKKGSVTTLEDNRADRRVVAKLDTASNKGTASISSVPQGRNFTITDKNTTNNTCTCR